MAAAKLTLGTLFTGDPTKLLTALGKIKKQMNIIAKAAEQLQSSMGAMDKAVKAGAKGMSSMGSELTAFQKAAGQATTRTQQYQKAFTSLAGTFGKSEAAMRQWLPALNKADAAIGRQAMSLHGISDKAKAFNAQTSRMSVMQDQLAGKIKYTANGWKEISAQTGKASKVIKKATTQYQGLNKQLSRVHGGLERVKAAFKVTASYGIAATAIYSVINALKVGTQSIIDYDQALKNLQAITGATDAEVSAMGDTMRTVAQTTKFSTSEVAEGMVLLGQAGFDAGESISAIQATANLATGTLSDMKLTTDLLTTTIRAFNLDTIESGRVSDVMANAINKSKLTIDKLRIAFNYIAATASQAGLTLEQTAATMMTLANNGLRASTIGTGLRQVLSRLLKPNDRLRGSLEQVGLTLNDINPRMVGWRKALESLTAILYNSETKTVDMAKAFKLFGLRGAQAAAVVVKSFVSGDYENALKKVYELGTAADMAAKQQEGLGVKFKQIADKTGVLAVALGESGMAGALHVFADALRGTLDALIAFSSSVGGQMIIQTVALTGVVIGLRKAFVLLAPVINKVIFTSKKAITVFAIFSEKTVKLAAALKTLVWFFGVGKVGGIAAGIAAAVTVIYTMITAQDRAVKSAERLAVKQMQMVTSLEAYKASLREIAQRTFAEYYNALTNGTTAEMEYLTQLKRLIKAHPELADAIQMSVDAYGDNNRVIQEFLDLALDEELRLLIELSKEYSKAAENAKVWAGVWREIKRGFEEWYDFFMWGIKNIGDTTGDVMSGILTVISKVIYEIGAIASTALGPAGKYVESWSKKVAEAVSNAGVSIKKYFTDLGKHSMSANKSLEKQIATWDAYAMKVADIGKKERQTLEEIEAAWRKAGGTNETMLNHILAKVKELRAAEHEYSAATKKMLGEMNDAWRTHFETLDINGKAEVQKYWDNLQSKINKHKEALKKITNDRAEQEAALKVFLDKELANYIAIQDKKVVKAQKAADKQTKIYEKLMGKVRSLEEKLAEDLKVIHQAGMTDAEKVNDDLIAARQALADAKKAIAEGETTTKMAEAVKQLEIAREKYRAILDLAQESGEKRVEIIKESLAQEVEISSSLYDYWTKWYKDLGYQVTTYTETVIKEKKKEEKAEKSKTETVKEEVEKQLKEIERLAGEATNKINESLDGLAQKAAEPKPVNVVTDEAEREVSGLDLQLGYLNEKIAEPRTLDINVNPFLRAIQSAINKVQDLINRINKIPKSKSVNIKVNISEHTTKTSSGGEGAKIGYTSPTAIFSQSGGKIPGYGGGDKVPSMLERGEFVVKKEAVAKYGAGFFSALNSMMPSGGSEKIGGAGLHTINLNINNTPHTLYGDEQAVNGLVKSLRRAQLVTA